MTRSGRRGITLLALALAALSAPHGFGQSIWQDRAFALVREGNEALDRGDLDRAASLARQAIADYPDHVLAWDLVAQAAMGQRRWDDAVTALRRILTHYPASFAARRDLGVALNELGRLDEAAAAFEGALAQRATGLGVEDVQLRLAFLRLRAQDPDRALPLLETLAQGDSPVPEVWTSLGRLYYERSALEPSERAFRKAATLRDEGRTWFNLAVVRLRLFDKAGAIDALDRAARHPDVREAAERELAKLRGDPAPGVPGQPSGTVPHP